jgi:hypothetical protein
MRDQTVNTTSVLNRKKSDMVWSLDFGSNRWWLVRLMNVTSILLFQRVLCSPLAPLFLAFAVLSTFSGYGFKFSKHGSDEASHDQLGWKIYSYTSSSMKTG